MTMMVDEERISTSYVLLRAKLNQHTCDVNLEKTTRSFSLPSLSSQSQASVRLGDGSVLQDVNLEVAMPLSSPVSSPSSMPSRAYNREEISFTLLYPATK